MNEWMDSCVEYLPVLKALLIYWSNENTISASLSSQETLCTNCLKPTPILHHAPVPFYLLPSLRFHPLSVSNHTEPFLLVCYYNSSLPLGLSSWRFLFPDCPLPLLLWSYPPPPHPVGLCPPACLS